jgi:hypothetical protein
VLLPPVEGLCRRVLSPALCRRDLPARCSQAPLEAKQHCARPGAGADVANATRGEAGAPAALRAAALARVGGARASAGGLAAAVAARPRG